MPDYLKVCEAAARAGGQQLLDWAERFDVREKGPADLVTQADMASQAAIRELLLDRFPDHAFLGEEGPDHVDFSAPYCWVVDPLDGTTNYVHGIPHYAVSIALVEHGRPLVGVVFDPISRECYTAELGAGAFLNGERLQTSQVRELSQAVVAASFPARVAADAPEVDQFNAALLATQGVRRTGSAALNLCYVAAGRFDGFWAMSTKAWDVAAGVLLVAEAGGVVSNLRGEPLDLNEPHPVASAGRELHDQLQGLLLRAAQSR